MKNYLVITLGTSDVQILEEKLVENDFIISESKDNITNKSLGITIDIKPNRNHQNTHLLKSPRLDGEKIINIGIEKVLSILDFPLVLPAITQFFEQNIGKQIDKCLFIFTDQNDPVFRNTDTLHFATILKRKLKLAYGFSEQVFMDFPIYEKVTNIDFQYENFAKQCHSILDTPIEEIGQVVLFTQGGIDQINQALTLQFIQAYKHKLKLYQKAEGSNPIVLNFPKLFLNDLNKQKIIKHLADYDFGAIDKGLSSKKEVYHLAQYATKRLNLQYDLIETNIRALPNYQLEANIQDDFEKLKDIYLAAKINYQQQRYTEFLWRTYTLNESLFKIEIKKLVGNEVDNFTKITNENKDKLTSWENALNRIDLSLISEIARNKMPNGYSVDTKNPNRVAFKILFNALVKLNCLNFSVDAVMLYNRIGDKLEALSSERNGIAHKLGSTSIAQINAILNAREQGYTSKNLLSDLDQIFNIQGFGIYDTIKKEIEALL